MNTSESTRIVYDRIKKIEPELASKIVGYLLLGDDSEREMLRLAFCPDNVIQAITDKVKSEFGNKPSYTQNAFPIHLQPQSNNTYWHPGPQLQRASELHHQQLYATAFSQEYSLQLRNQMQHLCLDERYQPRFPAVQSAKMQSKICQYFSSGFCKHGSSCRYLHGNPNEGFAEDQLVSPRSIKKLEFELTELLRSRNGLPVSIALLPMLYFDKFGRNLQAEGYLTESQRHGKAGFSLTKLLARMRPHIHIIESRAHGQHSVVLGEDIHKYMEYANEQNDHGSVSIGERQIYLTFPAESVFTEQDVSNYFNGFGSVQDVRIPCQQKRMFGFVTFLFPETVRKILAKGNPHFVCGARVLVKPYKEKSRLAERKTSERKNAANFCLQFVDGDPNIQNNSESRAACMRLVSKQFLEQEQALELERRLSELQLVHNPLAGNHGILYSTAELNPHEAYSQQADVPVAERYGFLLDVLKDESTSEARANCTSSSYNDQESCSNQGLHLPTSPFTSSKVNSISNITSLKKQQSSSTLNALSSHPLGCAGA